jgi:hypothetical protein
MTRPRGRPSKLNEETKIKLFDAIKGGNTLEAACEHAGISYRTMKNWEERGQREQSGEYFHFFEEIEQAKGLAEVELVRIISCAALEDWRAGAWLLERLNPLKWSLRPEMLQKRLEIASIGAQDDSWAEMDREIIHRTLEDPVATEHLIALTNHLLSRDVTRPTNEE